MTTIANTGMKRRTFLGGATAAGLSAALVGRGWLDAAAFMTEDGVDIDGLKAAGYDVRHTICHGCGAACGLSALIKPEKNVAEGEPNFVLFGNAHPDHPQPGICGRGASSAFTWNSPLRLKKPLKRVGERGSGEFQEISWEQALDEIASKLKGIIETDGPEAFAVSRHEFKAEAEWLTMGLNTPNLISQSSTCNTAGVVARKWMMGGSYSHHAKIDPDYDNARFVLFTGRQMAAPIGAQTRMARAKANGAKFAFLNPAHPDAAYGSNEWIPCKPGSDAAFLMGVSKILVDENLYDQEFVTRHTNLAYLIKADGKPLVAADLSADGGETDFQLFDGANILSHEAIDGAPVLEYETTVELQDGTQTQVRTAWLMFKDHLQDYGTNRVASITGVPAETVVRMARTLAGMRGCVEDTWYNTRNGNDTDAVMAIMTVNGLLGNIDKPGGMCFKPSVGLPGMLKRASDGTITTPLGDELKLPPVRKSIDKMIYPETNGSFEAVVRSVLGDDAPYKIKALLVTDGTLFHRDVNTRRIEQMLRGLDLFVMIDIVHQEACDWADYVLPGDMFLEREHIINTKWVVKPSAALAQRVTEPPPGAEVRHIEWINLEILSRIYPERARALGYKPEFKDPVRFREDFQHKIEKVRMDGLAKKWNWTPEKVEQQLIRDGFINFGDVEYDTIPYKKPFDSATGKLEIYAFYPVLKGYRDSGFAAYFEPPAFTMPSNAREFIIVSGKQPTASSGVASLAYSSVHMADNRVWINPEDAARLEVKDGDKVEIEGLDTGWKGEARLRVTPRVVAGSLFSYSYVGGNRQRALQDTEGFAALSEGINIHWFTTAALDPVTGANANNASVRINRTIA